MTEIIDFLIDTVVTAAVLLLLAGLYLVFADQDMLVQISCALQTNNNVDQAACYFANRP
jgi:hypothetical protein